MYATTKLFLDYFNLKTLSDLPSLAEIRDLDKINAELNFADMAMDQAESKHEQGAMIDIEEPFEIVENEDNDMTSQPQVLD